MSTCFVIQPFDKGKYDKRYRDCFKPAIEAADLVAYRVDEDPHAEVGIESIESGIRNASVCLADISEDNANVWYELGFAFALNKPVVMVCAEQSRSKFPFDIQHRIITLYKAEAPSDFEQLALEITERIKARVTRDEIFKQAADAQQISTADGLSAPELMLVAAIAAETESPDASTVVWRIKESCERQGLTSIGFQIALRRLKGKAFIEVADDYDPESDRQYKLVSLTSDAWSWIDRNENRFITQKQSKATLIADPDIPF